MTIIPFARRGDGTPRFQLAANFRLSFGRGGPPKPGDVLILIGATGALTTFAYLLIAKLAELLR